MRVDKIFIGIAGLLLCFTNAVAQNDFVKFGAVSRGVLQESTLDDSDTTNPNKDNGGQTMVDLRININPNKKTEIGTVIRMQSELGGYFGAGSEVSLRQLYVKGLLYDVVSYELGDIYLEMTPYTLFNSDGDLSQSEALVFGQLRSDFTEYDNFNIGNSWWTQGGHVNFGLQFDSLAASGAQFDVFTSRITAPTTMRFMSGGRATFFSKNKYDASLNVVSTYDARRVNPLEESLSNSVATLSFNVFLNENISVFGETGLSNYSITKPYDFEGEYIVPEDREGEFIKLGVKASLMDKLGIRLKYLRNSANFYSIGAQTKRLDFTASPELFLNVANDPFNNRALNIYDVVANRSMYNPVLSGTLMAYDPMYGNVLPYGEATPNRQGPVLNATFADSDSLFQVGAEGMLLTDVTGVGTEEKTSFTKANVFAEVNVGDIVSIKKEIKIHGAYNVEKTTRDGQLSGIDLSTSSLDVGLEAEVFKNFYLLGGVKTLSGKGNELLYDLSNDNIYAIPTDYELDQNQTLLGVGAKYRFSEKMYLSVKNLNMDVKNNLDTDLSYSFNQWILFFSLKL